MIFMSSKMKLMSGLIAPMIILSLSRLRWLSLGGKSGGKTIIYLQYFIFKLTLINYRVQEKKEEGDRKG